MWPGRHREPASLSDATTTVDLISAPIDFLGVNHYNAHYVKVSETSAPGEQERALGQPGAVVHFGAASLDGRGNGCAAEDYVKGTGNGAGSLRS